MGGLFGGKGAVQKTAPAVSSLRITTSSYGRPIPLGWGLYRMASWVMWYRDFKAIAHTEQVASGGKGGGGGGTTTTTYTYQTAIIMGLCEVPVNAALHVWKGQDYLTGAGTSTQTRQKTEYGTIQGSQITVNAPATITSTISVVIPGTGYDNPEQVLAEGVSFTRSGNVYDLTGSGLPDGVVVVITYAYSDTTAPTSALGQANLTLAKGSYTQLPWTYLTSNHPSEALAYRGISYVASPVYDLGSDSALPNTSVELDSGFGYSNTIRDVNPRDFLNDFLTNPRYGANLTVQGIGDWSDYSTYCIANGLFLSPEYTEQEVAGQILARVMAITNSDLVFSDKKLEIVPYADQAVTGNGKTWTPDLTAAYALTDNDFLPNGDGGPIKLKRKSPDERYNQLRVKFRNRAKQYNDDIYEAKDEAEIGRNGLRPEPNEQETPEVKDKDVAVAVGNLLVQRSVNVCNTYVFKLAFRYALLKPMALLTLTYAPMLLSGQLVRVVKITEQGNDGELEIEAEEVPIGAASSILYPTQAPVGPTVNFNVAPGSVATPVIFEAPAQLTTTGLEVLVAARGTDPNWGGYRVHVSLDGTTYKEVARLEGGSRYGTLTAPISSGTLPVSIVGGQLLTATAAEAAALTTLCYIGGAVKEFLAYQTATLTGALAYNLTGLVRGAYNTATANTHATSDPFVRIDEAVGRSGPLDLTYIGKTIYFKLTSFNIYGLGEESLADVPAYSYLVTGVGAQLLPGIGGKSVELQASGLTFQFPKTGGVNPSAITLTAVLKGLLVGTPVWSVVAGSATLTGSGLTRTLSVSNLATDSATIRVVVTDGVGTYQSEVTIVKVREGFDADTNLLDATWWLPGAAWEWKELLVGPNSIIWATGPQGNMQAIWKAEAPSGGGPGGGWDYDTIAAKPKNAFLVDPSKVYRFAVPVKAVSGNGSWYLGVTPNAVCDLNTATPNGNPYFVADSGVRNANIGKWCLLVGYVFPAGSTGVTNDGAGIFDMATGALLAGGINYCWAAGTSQASSRSYLYYAVTGAVQQWAPPSVQIVTGTEARWLPGPAGAPGSPGSPGAPGTDATQVATAYLYTWNTGTPPDPSGTSTFTWSTGTNGSYTGGTWSVGVGTNPGTPGAKLWVAAKQVTATATAASTSVSWASGFSKQVYAQNGADGSPGSPGSPGANAIQTAYPEVYQWAASIPSGPTGFSIYTWAAGTFGSAPSGWSLTPGTSPSPGFTLWAATVSVVDSATVATTGLNWASAAISAKGYAGTQGPPGSTGAPGSPGAQGASARVAYTAISGAGPLGTSPSNYTVSGDNPPSASSWGGGTYTYAVPSYGTGDSLWQSDGIYDPVTNQTVWGVPYLSNFKVGSLSAITVNTGALNATGNITTTSGAVVGGAYTGYAWPAVGLDGFYLGPSGLLLGNSNNGKYLQVTAAGDIYAPGFSVVSGAATFSGALSAASGTFAGALSSATGTFLGTVAVGSAPAVSGSTMTGTGAVFNSGGTFAIGNSSKNISFNGTTLTLNGNLVTTGNIVVGAVSANAVSSASGGFPSLPNSTATYDTGTLSFSPFTASGGYVSAVCSIDVFVGAQSTAVDSIRLWAYLYRNGVQVDESMIMLRSCVFPDPTGATRCIGSEITLIAPLATGSGTVQFDFKLQVQFRDSTGTTISPGTSSFTSHLDYSARINLQEIKV